MIFLCVIIFKESKTSKTVSGVKTPFLLDGYNVIEQTDGTTTLHFFHDSNGEVIGFRYNGNDYFYVKNAMNDIIAITDSNKNIVAEYRYDPWGKVLGEYDLTAIGNLNPFRYRSYYYDNDIKMYYLQSRYYDAEVGRFINCDDVNYIGVTESEISYNPFAYCENNPINESDYNGTAIKVFVCMAIGAALGVLGLFVLDVVFNLCNGTSPWYTFSSSTEAYISAAIGGALATINFKKLSVLVSGITTTFDELLKCWKNGKKVNIKDLLLAVSDAVLMDIILPGEGLDLSNKIEVIQTSMKKLKTLVSIRKIRLYKDKIRKSIKSIIKNGFFNIVSNIINFIRDKKIIERYTSKLKQGYNKVVCK